MDHHLRAFAGEEPHHAFSDARGRAGNQNHFILQTHTHPPIPNLGSEKKPQISPLRYAPVEMTSLFGNAKYRFQDELSSRPERSVVERSAVLLAFITQTLYGLFFLRDLN
jgi:hypothetical protein